MKQKQAVIKALEILGGKGHLKWIQLIAPLIPDVVWTTKTPEASVRRLVRQYPDEIIPLSGGQYELVAHRKEQDRLAAERIEAQEEIARLGRLTLEKVVDYAKGRHDYDEAKPIVAMLDKVFRSQATPEELQLIDSIEQYYIQRDYPKRQPSTPENALHQVVLHQNNYIQGSELTPALENHTNQ